MVGPSDLSPQLRGDGDVSARSADRSRSPRGCQAGSTPPSRTQHLPFDCTQTREQREVCRRILSGRSLRIVANAGTGKTATLLHAADQLPKSRKVLFLAYNRDIRLEVQEEVQRRDLNNVTVENYDSLLLNYYDGSAASQDFQISLHRVLETDRSPRCKLVWDTFFVDEAQDLDQAYLRFLNKVLRDTGSPRERLQLVSVGDFKQTIFRYREADAAIFLHDGPQERHLHGPGTETLQLTETFRFGPELCVFVDRLVAPLFPGRALPHRSGLAQTSPGERAVEHWVLPPAGLQPQALIERLVGLRGELEARAAVDAVTAAEQRLLAFLTGSKRDSNEPLWRFVEALAAASPPLLVAEDAALQLADGPALAFLRNVHSCKGKSFAVAVLFVTTRRSWLAPGGVEAELLYVALTRARRLLIVEAADALLFQEVLRQAGCRPDALPCPARCAATGAELALPLQRAGRSGAILGFAKPSLQEQLGKLAVPQKRQLLELLGAAELCVWSRPGEPPLQPGVSSAALLVATAAWLWLERGQEDEDGAFRRCFQALQARRPAEEAYAQLWPRRAAGPLAAHLRARLERLATRPELAAPDFLEAARLHPQFHHGHLALPESTAEQGRDCAALRQRLAAELRRLGPATKLSELCGGPCLLPGAAGVYLAAARVVFLKAETAQAEGLLDRLLAAYAAARHGVEAYEIVYVPLEEERATERARGSLPAADGSAAAYLSAFERALGVLQLTGRSPGSASPAARP